MNLKKLRGHVRKASGIRAQLNYLSHKIQGFAPGTANCTDLWRYVMLALKVRYRSHLEGGCV